MPCFNVTPVSPNGVIKLVAPLTQAETTASLLTTKPRKRPVFADVFATTVQPVKPAENYVLELIMFFLLMWDYILFVLEIFLLPLRYQLQLM